MEETILLEETTLLFRRGRRGIDEFPYVSRYDTVTVGLCNRPLCEDCNLPARDSLKGFRDGKLKVHLSPPYRRPSLWEAEGTPFYVAHLLEVLPPEKIIQITDEGIEFDASGSNVVVCSTPQGIVVIDPGSMGFDGDPSLISKAVPFDRNVLATIVTHGHQDHWGFLGETRGPVYMGWLTFCLASRHANLGRNSQLARAVDRARLVMPGQPVILEGAPVAPVAIDTIPLPHSIPQAMGLVIQGDNRRAVHLADIKLAGMDPESKAETIARLREVARKPVDLLSLNIVNAHIPGFTPIEARAVETITTLLAQAKGRVIVACFSTNLGRIHRIAEVAKLLERPVAFCGSGMRHAQYLLRELFGLDLKEEGDSLEADQAMVFVTGCQAEEHSVLDRIARGNNPPFELRPSDMLIFSSRCIPGNEPDMREHIHHLHPLIEKVVMNEGETERVGLQGLEIEENLVHVTGHGCQEDLRLVLEILQPKQVLPWPQKEPQINAFRKLADSLGIEILPEEERVFEV